MPVTKFWTGGKGDGLIASDGNWSDGTAPVAGDTLHFRNGAAGVAPGQDTSAATYAKVIFDDGYTGIVANVPAPWVIAASVVEIWSESGSINLDLTNVASVVNVHNSASESSVDEGRPPIYIKANENTTVINVFSGNVAVADLPGDTATIGTLNVGWLSSAVSGSPVVTVGAGCTLTTGNIRSGTCTMRGNGTNLTQYGGELTLNTADSFSNVSVYGGTFYGDAFNTITNFAAAGTSGAAVADFLRTSNARTITNTSVGRNATVKMDTNNVTQTNKTDFLYPVTCVVSGV